MNVNSEKSSIKRSKLSECLEDPCERLNERLNVRGKFRKTSVVF